MTADERALDLVDAGFAAKEIASWGLDDPEAFRVRLAAAIRAAEREAADEALERAAVLVAEQAEAGAHSHGVGRWLARKIRSLKSGGGR